MRRNHFHPRRLLIAAAIIGLVLTALLALDLANQGLAWRIFWSLTGEETPAAQIRGMVEWVGNFTRSQPQTASDVPVEHAGVNPFGVNTFLEQEVEIAKRERQVRMIAEAGFTWIRQQFPWEDIEIHGRGDFEDRRHLETHGAFSAWDKYDNIVDLTGQYGLRIIARLDAAPEWSHADPQPGTFPPPDDLQDYVNFATAVAERYRGRIQHYQIWNEPNIYPEWGANAVNPEAYTDMLCRTYAALKAVDPSIVVIAGALSPTISLTERDLNDFIYLQRMYDAGAKDCFDVLSTQGYGFFSGPTDRRLRTTMLNFSRPIYLRDLMVANGDAHKAIWISEAAWNPVDSPDVPPDLVGRESYGSVTQEQAARYMPLAYERARQEMPWLGVINYWFFKRATDLERDQPFYYFRMVEPDFTPLPIYDAIRDYTSTLVPTLYAGVHQADHWAIDLGDAEIEAAAGAEFGQASRALQVTFNAHGTNVMIRWQGERLQAMVDGETVGEYTHPDPQTWNETTVFRSMTAERHTFTLDADAPFLLDSVTVADRTLIHLTPLIAGAVIGVGMVIGVIVASLRERRRQPHP